MSLLTFALRRSLQSSSSYAEAGYRLLCLFRERARQRRALQTLDDSLLKDIGLSRGDAEREARRWFWQA